MKHPLSTCAIVSPSRDVKRNKFKEKRVWH
nr:MAG TPA: hypothetical protein [Inoviridae sp.]